ncbi:MAG TPA: bifunctional diguanylate cyclase/phosphodiesterase [Bacillus bacterium]|nr:bifunctional diguanylate cyclase/phosphodiesterase [Bacillus sp. (in: firmicutes)]
MFDGVRIGEQKEIVEIVENDRLTGLISRESFENFLGKALANSNGNITIMFVDINRFKFINDAYGFSVGDEVIKKAAERIKECIGNEGIIARLYGDDFGILLIDSYNNEQIEILANKLVDHFKAPIQINDNLELHVSISVGINRCETSVSNDVDSTLKNAYLALNFAKDSQNGEFCYYNSFIDKISQKIIGIGLDMQKAIENNEFVLAYQPKVDLSNFTISGIEGLLRWNHPLYGLIPPSEFIPIAESTKEIIPIGKWVIDEGFKQATKWLANGINFKRLALNVSPLQFYSSDFVKFIEEMLQFHHLDPEFVELEITESVMNNIGKALDIINQLRKLGIKITLDDFGTGFSSLNVLNKLPFDCLKIDQTFVRQLFTDKKTGILTRMIIQMGRELDMELVAEGIERMDQLTYLRNCNCDVGQGFYFSKPLFAKDLEAYLQK